MSREGWIKCWRKVLENPIVMKSPDHFVIWHMLLYNAEPKPKQALFGGKPITLKPGQLTTGRKQLSVNSGIAESKVERVLKDLESAQQIEQQTSSKNRLITILQWSDYQASEQQNEQRVNNKRTTTEQRANTLEEVKKKRREEYSRAPAQETDEEMAERIRRLAL